ncbi:hypothetical protein XELAEV_18035679mg [Xenopus laevis]|uniref:G-protein coupled receptors family 1 profile domain-containing protein n=1 Tax=Xenopus laevis TaxID=8355 RepID=A0A974CH85_XENLA|nr:hypothetical protein XELAEV_18035679mg [Xenopus laevis]
MKYPDNNSVTEIILSGFPNLHHYSPILFTVLLVIYLFIITGNILICVVVQKEPSLHSPMYFFIGALSLMELCYTGAPALFLTLFIKLAATCIISGFLSPVIGTVSISSLPFCGPNCIQTLFCDFLPLIALACTGTRPYILVEFVVGSLIILLSCIFVLQSYSRIIYVILRIKSRKGRQKTFSTCGAHLIVVILFFGSISFTYIRLNDSYSANSDRAVGVVYDVFTPLANPIIYGLRNKEIKKSLHKHLHFSLLF